MNLLRTLERTTGEPRVIALGGSGTLQKQKGKIDGFAAVLVTVVLLAFMFFASMAAMKIKGYGKLQTENRSLILENQALRAELAYLESLAVIERYKQLKAQKDVEILRLEKKLLDEELELRGIPTE